MVSPRAYPVDTLRRRYRRLVIDFDVANDGANRATVRAVSADGQQVMIEHWTADGAVEELHRRDGT